MTKVTHHFLAGACLFASSLLPVAKAVVIPAPPTVNASSFILMDYRTGTVIAAEQEHEPHAPASLTKVMTNYVIGKELESGNISLSDEVLISERAWARNFPGSSLMFIEVGKKVTVEDLQKGIVISSGNDASVAMAEYIAGTTDAFADIMNAYAQRLGMHNTEFHNPHGLPSVGQVTTPYDMALLTQALISELPETYQLHGQREFTYNNIRQYNRNSLIWDRSLQVDGVKTGHTAESGYSLVSSATNDDMRLIAVVMGANSESSRAAESKKLLNYGFRYYETIHAYHQGDVLATQPIWGATINTLDLGTQADIYVTIPKGQRDNLKAELVLQMPLEAPLEAGTVVGTVQLSLDGESITSFPLITLQPIHKGGFFKRLIDGIKKRF